MCKAISQLFLDGFCEGLLVWGSTRIIWPREQSTSRRNLLLAGCPIRVIAIYQLYIGYCLKPFAPLMQIVCHICKPDAGLDFIMGPFTQPLRKHCANVGCNLLMEILRRALYSKDVALQANPGMGAIYSWKFYAARSTLRT